MIYTLPGVSDPIRQGDIFRPVPRIDLRFNQIPRVEDDTTVETSWEEVAESGDAVVTAVVGLRPVAGIVITQDCDATHADQITLCEIRPFKDVERRSAQASSDKAWVSIITQHSRQNLKWFYLPADTDLGFGDKMGVDFQVTVSVLREDLENFRRFRIGRLNPESDEHFRERLAEFFRRYPYDEWYPLTKAEFEQYKRTYPDVDPRPWQS